MKTKNLITVSILILFAILGALIYQYSTPIGLGLTNDSSAYLNGAQNLLSGNGYGYNSGRGEVKPITHFPPAYAATIAGTSLVTGLEPQRAARLLGMALIAANIVLAGLALGWMTRSRLMAGVGAAWVLTSEMFLYVHVYLLSEPLYLLVSGLALLITAMYFEYPRWPLLALAGLFACFAFLTRYVGLAVIGAVIAGLLFGMPDWKRKIRSTLVFLAFSLPGVLAWTLRNWRLTGNPTNRDLIFHPITAVESETGLKNFWTWFLPGRFTPPAPGAAWGWAAAALGLLVVAGVILALLRLKRKPDDLASRQPGLFLFGLYTLGYIVLIFLSMTFFDSSTKFEFRMIIPALLAGSLFLLGWLWQALARRPIWIRVAALLVLALGLLWNAQDANWRVNTFHADGQGFLALNWRISKTIAYINTKMPDRVIYSNRAPLIYLLTDHTAYVLPTRVDNVKDQARDGYLAEVEKVRKDVMNGAVIILFQEDLIQETEEGRAWINDLTHGLEIIEKTSDGIVYAAPN